MIIIAIAGGSGSGKSTVSYRLVDTYPDFFEILNFDDYQKLANEPNLPKIFGKINWEHPDVIDWNKLQNDIDQLFRGKEVTIQTWAHRSNPNYFKHRKMIPRMIIPKKVLIVEGYFALYDSQLRKSYNRMYFLNLKEKLMLKRRKKFDDPDYDSKILIPMHKKYIEPTKKYADLVLNVSKMTEDEVYKKIENDIKNSLGVI